MVLNHHVGNSLLEGNFLSLKHHHVKSDAPWDIFTLQKTSVLWGYNITMSVYFANTLLRDIQPWAGCLNSPLNPACVSCQHLFALRSSTSIALGGADQRVWWCFIPASTETKKTHDEKTFHLLTPIVFWHISEREGLLRTRNLFSQAVRKNDRLGRFLVSLTVNMMNVLPYYCYYCLLWGNINYIPEDAVFQVAEVSTGVVFLV